MSINLLVYKHVGCLVLQYEHVGYECGFNKTTSLTHNAPFLEVGCHDNDLHVILPDHSPEVLYGIVHRTLRSYVLLRRVLEALGKAVNIQWVIILICQLGTDTMFHARSHLHCKFQQFWHSIRQSNTYMHH